MLKNIIQEIVECEMKEIMILKESKEIVSEELIYHLDNNINLCNTIFRYGSEKHLELINEVRELYKDNLIVLCEDDEEIINSEAGLRDLYEGKLVSLDLPFEDFEDEINEAEYKGKKVSLGKPKRGGSKKFYVYVRNPKTKKIMKVSFGAKDGGGNLAVKLRDPKARKRFADRHNCEQKNDKTTPGYWSCRLPRFSRLLNLSGGGKWW
jgi:hypothetical protein